MGILGNITTDNNIKQEADTLGSGRVLLDSGVVLATIKVAYLSTAASGAVAVNLIADVDGKEYKETCYITNKDKQSFYVDKKSGEKRHLAGFLIADAIALLTTGKSVVEQDTEKKIISIFSFEHKKDLPTEVECLTAMHGKQVQLGILKECTFKREKQADGSYAEVNEKQESNVIDRVFHPTHSKTVAECRAQAEKAEFIDQWKDRWSGKVKDKTEGKTPKGSTSSTGFVGAATSAPTSTTSLFN